jgi:acetyl esterase/lipase
MIRVAAFVLLGFAVPSLMAADPVVVKLWPGKAPGEEKDIGPEKLNEPKPGQPEVKRLTNVSEPTISVYLPPKDKANGAAVIVAPGGGYNILAIEHEGTDVCKWLNDLGVTAVLLKYRVPRRPGQKPENLAALQDAQRAVSIVRTRAAEWGIDPNRIGFLGFSAGGNLTACVAMFDKRFYEPIDEMDKASHTPSFAVPVYPAYLSDNGTLKPEYTATKDTPPMFLIGSADDKVCNEGMPLLFLSLRKANVPCEMHLYAVGGHGYGMRKIPHPAASWPDRCADWMQTRGYLKAAK